MFGEFISAISRASASKALQVFADSLFEFDPRNLDEVRLKGGATSVSFGVFSQLLREAEKQANT